MGNKFDALNRAKQDANVREALKKGDVYDANVHIRYHHILEYVQNKITEDESYRRVLNEIVNEGNEEKAKAQLMNIISTLLAKYDTPLDPETIERFKERIYHDMTGFGLLNEYLDDPKYEEINCFGFGTGQLEIVEAGKKPYRIDASFKDAQDLINMTQRMVRVGREKIDENNPRVDSYMTGGTRISAMISPVIREDKGAVFSIRKQTKARISIEDYVNSKTAMEEEFEFMRLCVRNGVSGATVGATGSGKTTLLNFLISDYCMYNLESARVYIIEESREMQLPEEAKVIYTAVTNHANAVDLLKSALRFHPTMICPAEMRGEEAMTAMNAAQTGHIVWSTFHADNCEEAYTRLLSMCEMAQNELSEELLMRNLCAAFPLIVSTQQLKDGSRRITGIYEAERVNGSEVIGHYIYKMQILNYEYAEDGKQVKKVNGYHMRVGDLSDKLAQRIFDNCGDYEAVKKFAREGWEPILHKMKAGMFSGRRYEEF